MTQLTIEKTAEDFLQECKNLKEQGLVEEAVSVYQRAIKFHQDSYELYHFLGETLAATNQLEAAIDAYKKAIEINPEFHWSYHCLSLVYLWQKRYDQAIEFCNKSIKVNPKIVPFYNQMGLILNHQGEIEKANIFYQKALDIESSIQDVEAIELEEIDTSTEEPVNEPEKKQVQEITNKTIETPKSKKIGFQGILEKIDGCVLQGWAWDSREPESSMTLVIHKNNEEVFRFAADRFREDLKRTGIGTGNYGFAIRLPLDICQAEPFNLKITIADSDYVLEKSLVEFTYNETYKPSFQGFCEPVSDEGRIKGWALDNENLDQKMDLYVYENHILLLKLKANLYREDIHKWKEGDGYYGYWSELPDNFLNNGFMDEQKPQLSICWGNSVVELSNSPVVIEKDALLNLLLQRTKQNISVLGKLADELIYGVTNIT